MRSGARHLARHGVLHDSEDGEPCPWRVYATEIYPVTYQAAKTAFLHCGGVGGRTGGLWRGHRVEHAGAAEVVP